MIVRAALRRRMYFSRYFSFWFLRGPFLTLGLDSEWLVGEGRGPIDEPEPEPEKVDWAENACNAFCLSSSVCICELQVIKEFYTHWYNKDCQIGKTCLLQLHVGVMPLNCWNLFKSESVSFEDDVQSKAIINGFRMSINMAALFVFLVQCGLWTIGSSIGVWVANHRLHHV